MIEVFRVKKRIISGIQKHSEYEMYEPHIVWCRTKRKNHYSIKVRWMLFKGSGFSYNEEEAIEKALDELANNILNCYKEVDAMVC